MYLASYNFGLPRKSLEDPSFEGFNLREPLNFEAAEQALGFVARSKYDSDESGAWGEQVFPRFIKGSGLESGLSQLSVWRDIETLMAFTYSGVHANALKHGHHWNRKREWPAVVLWWVDEDRLPTWSEAVERFEYLHDNGPSAFAFDFKVPFDSDGRPATIDRSTVKALKAYNARGQREKLTAVLAMKV
ncbi:DUF3291 domain-containing protein [Rhizobium sp. L1K21]|uniref:DUF3291 domain-containing protein n=1 Tax=Rhizobium sp. L1K21 TaxID=2954933 RepID=UPI0020929B3E|nr:DUF3291 domain-containing protein [Rhizobium sp. L1K21]MCO6188206.1 DUF3291 domain-containing protein [Rhizobium sp. L1K21]